MKNRTDLVLIYSTVKLLYLWTVFLKKGGLPSGKNSPGTSCKICWRFISVLKEKNNIPICTRSILNVDSLDSRRVFSLFERETTTGLFVGKLNAIYQKYNIKVHKTQPYLQIYIPNQNTGSHFSVKISKFNQENVVLKPEVQNLNKKWRKERENNYPSGKLNSCWLLDANWTDS
jgi:hypothetical protein